MGTGVGATRCLMGLEYSFVHCVVIRIVHSLIPQVAGECVMGSVMGTRGVKGRSGSTQWVLPMSCRASDSFSVYELAMLERSGDC